MSRECPCSSYPIEKVVEIIASSDPSPCCPSDVDDATIPSFEKLIQWIRGRNLPCQKWNQKSCRLRTARTILQAIRTSFPALEEPIAGSATTTATSTATCGRSSLDIKNQNDNPSPKPVVITVNDANAFPPLGASTTAAPTNPTAPSSAKKGKRRIRPVTVMSTTPLGASTDSNASKLNSVWGQTSSSSSSSKINHAQQPWPKTNQKNLLEHRLSSSCFSSNKHNAVNTQPKVVSASTHSQSSFPSLSTPTKAENANATPSSSVSFPNTHMLITPTKQKSNPETSVNSADILDPELLETNKPSLVVLRLVDLYAAIVDSLLVHSTPAAVSFLLQLLHGATTKQFWKEPENAAFKLTSTTANTSTYDVDGDFRLSCVQFSSLLLVRWSDRLIRWGVASHLVECPAVQQYCPELYRRAREYVSRTENAGQMNNNHRHVARRTTAFFTLPFDENRDSRNHYRTSGEMALYKNREETRDAFLSHLRAFYNQGTTLVQLNSSTKSAEQVRKAARSVMDSLWDDNVPWLAEFFTELLLQLGCVPIQETDQEVLQMADQDKVQKLHQRFNAPAARKGRGNNGGNKRPSSVLQEGSRTIAVQEEFFRGHQEFFYYFVMLADSHKFNHHLRHLLLQKLHHFSSTLSTQGMNEGVEDLCLLGRFLGLLVFSPNWHSSQVSLDESRSRSLLFDELGLLRFGETNLLEFMVDAWRHNRLLSVVPWVVEMLRMSSSDESFRRTNSFKELVGFLRKIHAQLALGKIRVSADCREVLSLCVESFVDEIAGLDVVEDLATKNAQDRRLDDCDIETKLEGIDSCSPSIDRSVVFALSSRTQIIDELLAEMTRLSRGLARSPGASRKVRPNSVSVSTLSNESSNYVSLNDGVDTSRDNKLQAQLRASFFHLHRDLQSICDFTLERTLKIALEKWKMIDADAMVILLPDGTVDWSGTYQRLGIKYDEIMDQEFQLCIKQSMDLFAPGIQDEVKQIAFSLALIQGKEAGRSKKEGVLSEAIASAKSKQRKLTNRDMSKSTSSVSLMSEIIECVQSVIKSMESIEQTDDQVGLIELIQKTHSSLDAWQVTNSNPTDEDLRSFYGAIFQLDLLMSPFLTSLLNTEIEAKNWILLSELLRLAAHASPLCSYGFQSVKLALSKEQTIMWFLSYGSRYSDATRLAELAEELCTSRLIPARERARVLDKIKKELCKLW